MAAPRWCVCADAAVRSSWTSRPTVRRRPRAPGWVSTGPVSGPWPTCWPTTAWHCTWSVAAGGCSRWAPAPTTAPTTSAVGLPATLVIGSHPACDVVLPGLRPRHAVLGHDLEGRSVLRALAGGCVVDGSPVVSQVVDADSDIRVGGHRVSLGELRSQAWCT